MARPQPPQSKHENGKKSDCGKLKFHFESSKIAKYRSRNREVLRLEEVADSISPEHTEGSHAL